jgi:hypothetical protein
VYLLSLSRCGSVRSKECFTTFHYFRPEISIFLSVNKSKYSCENHSTTDTIADCRLKEADKPIYVPAPPKILSVLKGFQLHQSNSQQSIIHLNEFRIKVQR